MKKTPQRVGLRRLWQTLAVACGTLMISSAVCSATILSLDFGPGPVAPGFQGYSTGSTNYGAIAVTETGVAPGFFDRGVGGTSSLAALYQDFLYMNGGAGGLFNVELDGLAPNATYEIRLYSYDNGLTGTITDQFVPTIGSGAPGSVTFNAASPPTTDFQDSTVVAWTTDGSGRLAFDTTGTGDGPRLDGLELLDIVIPEPSTVLLLEAGGLLLWRRKKIA